jgi:menaquinone reductase, multiheme cytochrome c subunit
VNDRKPRSPGLPLFPRWLDNTVKAGGLLAVVGVLVVIGLLYYGISPQAMDIGYEPKQPVPYSHRLHAGELGIDCRYCHNTVERSAFASVPPTETCMNCHTTIRPDSDKLLPVRESHDTGLPVQWIRVHDNPDFVYFNHSAHVTRGVGCVECHGRVDKMDEVYQAKALSMAWCLGCHRDPDTHLRPPEEVTNMQWVAPGDPAAYGAKLRKERDINPPTDCSTCHR